MLYAHQIAEEIASGRMSAREAVTGCIRRIEATRATLNAVVVARFDEALKEADEADEARARGEVLGPLHGVPVTIKESFDLAGSPTTAGLTHRAGHRAASDAWVVARLREAGAIVLGKTNVSQLLLHDSCGNPLYGQTNNPWRLDRSPGASSGGEAAILAVGGSALGIGSDIAGSIRLPADACGVHALKPTSGRLPLEGHLSVAAHQESALCQPGPLARSVRDLALAMRVLTDAAARDTNAETHSWRTLDTSGLRRLRIAFYTDNEVVKPAPAIRRAVTSAARALEGLGLTVEEWRPPNAYQMWGVYCSLLFSDGFRSLRRIARGSKLSPNVRQVLRLGSLPKMAFPIVAGVCRIAGQPQIADGIRYVTPLDGEEHGEMLDRRASLSRAFINAMDDAGIDAILCPVFATPAVHHRMDPLINGALSYTAIFNLLGMPAGTVAATRVRSGEESDRTPGMDLVGRAAKRVEIGSAGMPVGVQVAARPWREDVALAVMTALEEHFRAQPDYPAQPP